VSRPKGLRVIAGTARGRRLVAPPGDHVRPTKDIAREAVFSALEARGAVEGAAVLDLYAGTGALAIEALSRGAASATIVERDPAALAAIRTNLGVLPEDAAATAAVVARDVTRYLRSTSSAGGPFGLVFVDPPYDTEDEDVTAVLAALTVPGRLAPDAIVSVERPHRHRVVAPPGLQTGWERTFGDTLLTFLFG
jgi:16S rRNA (guanine966-N2)-methyltransferase